MADPAVAADLVVEAVRAVEDPAAGLLSLDES